MNFFFELLKNRIGFARMGRINLTAKSKKPIKTPTIVIPLKHGLKDNLDFIESFGSHEFFIINNQEFLKSDILGAMFKYSGFIFNYLGTLERFGQIFIEKQEIFNNNNVIPIIPFNIPTISVNFEFAKLEIANYLNLAETYLQNYPSINFGLSIKTFNYPELIDMYIEFMKNQSNVTILNFMDIFDWLYDYEGILKQIIKLKSEIDNNIVLFASGKIVPIYYPLLIYLGFDLIDSSHLLLLSSQNLYDMFGEIISLKKMSILPCICSSCRGNLKDLIKKPISNEKIDLLCFHNLITAKLYMKKTLQILNTEDFRLYVEKTSLNDLNSIALLRILDNMYYEKIKVHSKLVQKNKIIKSIGASSYFRPDFEYFRKNTIRSFSPEPITKLILIFPCSAKKPYSESKSHRKFLRVLRKFSDFPTFQEIILTSPLGAIPRQLENIYPVNSYDISVTGDWDAKEISIASNMLLEIIRKYDEKIPIICHVKEDYKKIIIKAESQLENRFYYTDITKHPINKQDLEKLYELINEHKEDYSIENISNSDRHLTKTWTRKFIKLIDYYFGNDLGAIFYDSLKTKYRKDRFNQKIELYNSETNEKLAIFKFGNAKLRLTTKGAERIAFSPKYSKYIIFDGEKLKGSTLFRPGIKEFDENLLPDDNICIFNESKTSIIAMGDMIVGSKFIKNSSSGRIVKLYETK